MKPLILWALGMTALTTIMIVVHSPWWAYLVFLPFGAFIFATTSTLHNTTP